MRWGASGFTLTTRAAANSGKSVSRLAASEDPTKLGMRPSTGLGNAATLRSSSSCQTRLRTSALMSAASCLFVIPSAARNPSGDRWFPTPYLRLSPRIDPLGPDEYAAAPVRGHDAVVLLPVVVGSAGRDEDLPQQVPQTLGI